MSEDTRRYRRHADDTVFRIEEQARSPNGAVTLRPAHYEGPAVHTTNDRLDVDFTRVDPVMPTVPTPAELIPKATDYAARIAEQTTAAIAQLRATQGKGASVRDETPVLTLLRPVDKLLTPVLTLPRPVERLLTPVEVEVDRLVTLLLVVLRPVLSEAS